MTDGKDTLKIQNLMIRISRILANIGGFCDKYSVSQIDAATRYFALSMNLDSVAYDTIRTLLPITSGIKVNFNKQPFKVIGLNLGNFGFRGEKG